MTDDHWWIMYMSINWILEQKLRKWSKKNHDEAADKLINRRKGKNIQFSLARRSALRFFVPKKDTQQSPTIGDLEASEQCSTNLNSTVILIMLVKALFFDSFCPLHWRNNRQSSPFFPVFGRKLSAKIVAKTQKLFSNNDNFRFNLSPCLADWNPWMKFSVRSRNGLFFVCVRRVCAQIWIINSSHEWIEVEIEMIKGNKQNSFFSIVNNWLMLFI